MPVSPGRCREASPHYDRAIGGDLSPSTSSVTRAKEGTVSQGAKDSLFMMGGMVFIFAFMLTFGWLLVWLGVPVEAAVWTVPIGYMLGMFGLVALQATLFEGPPVPTSKGDDCGFSGGDDPSIFDGGVDLLG
jgi:hypothetical protein